MKTKSGFLAVSLVFCCLSTILEAQPSTFTKVFYDSQGAAQAYALVRTFDQKYLIAGNKDYFAMVMKVDPNGSILWSKKIGNNADSRFSCITATSDSCFVLAGDTPDDISESDDILCVKINQAGDTLWTKAINLGQTPWVTSVQQTTDHGFILAVNLQQSIFPNSSMVAVKLDSTGNLTWARVLSAGNNNNSANAVKQTSDGGYIVTGYTENIPPPSGEFHMIRLTSAGDVSWAKKMSTGTYSSGFDVIVTTNGFVYLLLTSDPGMVIMKTDLSGNFLWSQEYNISTGGGNGLSAPKLHPTSDGGYAFISSGYGFDALLKTDALGNLQWGQTMILISTDVVGASGNQCLVLGNGPIYLTSKSPTDHPQIGLILTDSANVGSNCINPAMFMSGPANYTLVPATFTSSATGTLAHVHPQVAAVSLSVFEGCITVLGSVAENSTDVNSIRVSPNPSDGFIQITNLQPSGQPITAIEIFNSLGEKIYKSSNPIPGQLQVDLRPQPNGVYYIQAHHREKICTQKILICH